MNFSFVHPRFAIQSKSQSSSRMYAGNLSLFFKRCDFFFPTKSPRTQLLSLLFRCFWLRFRSRRATDKRAQSEWERVERLNLSCKAPNDCKLFDYSSSIRATLTHESCPLLSFFSALFVRSSFAENIETNHRPLLSFIYSILSSFMRCSFLCIFIATPVFIISLVGDLVYTVNLLLDVDVWCCRLACKRVGVHIRARTHPGAARTRTTTRAEWINVYS